MDQPIVLVTFSCQSGEVEKLALSAAVGAVQARALIRLRRLPDAGGSGEALARMRKEYVAPTEADILGADALILAAGSDDVPWQGFLNLFHRLQNEGKLDRKVVATIGGLSSSFRGPGLIAVNEPTSDPITLGRNVANKARSIKSS